MGVTCARNKRIYTQSHNLEFWINITKSDYIELIAYTIINHIFKNIHVTYIYNCNIFKLDILVESNIISTKNHSHFVKAYLQSSLLWASPSRSRSHAIFSLVLFGCRMPSWERWRFAKKISEVSAFSQINCQQYIPWWWQLKYFLIFTQKIGEDEPNLTSIFFRWVETTQ